MFKAFATLSGIKTSDTAVAFIGDVVTYTIQVTTSGNTDAVNVTVSDPPPQGTSLIAGSIFVNNVPQSGTDPAQIDVGTISPGSTATITFESHVDALHNLPQIVNQAVILYDAALPLPSPSIPQPPVPIPPNVISVVSPNLNAALQANRTVTAPGDTITYTITAANTGNTSLKEVTVVDALPSGTSLVAGSVTINGVTQPGADPASGVAVGSLPVGQTAVVIYQASVTTSAGAAITNQARVFFIPDIPYRILPPRLISTNAVTIPVLQPSLNLTKQADRPEVVFGDTMSYTIRAVNTGNTNLVNVIVTDTPPSGTEFVVGSTAVNSIPQPGANPAAGINTGGLSPGQSVTVSFAVRVVIDETNVVNQAQASFTPNIPGLTLPPLLTKSNLVVTVVVEEEE